MNSDENDRCVRLNFVNDRFFRQCWKRRNSIDTRFDFGQDLIDISILRYLDRDRSIAFTGTRANFGNPLNILDGLLDLDDDAFFNFLRCGAEIGHLHLYPVEFNLRCRLFANRERRNQTRDDNEPHQKIGGDMIACKPGNDARLTGRGSDSHV